MTNVDRFPRRHLFRFPLAVLAALVLLPLLGGPARCQPALSLSPDSLGTTLVSGHAAPLTLTIANPGTSDLTWGVMADTTPGRHYKVLVLSSESNPLADHLNGMPGMQATNFAARYSVPTLEQLSGYDVAVVVTGYIYGPSFPEALGSVLADYVDHGGGVVLTGPSIDGISPTDRFSTGGYAPYAAAGSTVPLEILGARDSLHPIMRGVARVGSPDDWYLSATPTLAPGAREIARFVSGNSAVATRGDRVVAVNLSYGYYATYSYDSPRLLYNAVVWAAGGDWMKPAAESGVLAPGGRLDLPVSFDARGLGAGGYGGRLAVFSDDPAHPRVVIPAGLQVLSGPAVAVPAALDFGTVFDGTPRTLRIANSGIERLVVSSVSCTGSFSAPDTSFALDPGAGVEIAVRLAAGTSGPATGTLSVASNDPVRPQATVALSGTALAPPMLGVSPSALSATVSAGQSTTRTLTIANDGGSDLTWKLRIHGGAAVDPVTRAAPADLASGTARQLKVLIVQEAGEADWSVTDSLRAMGDLQVDWYGVTWGVPDLPPPSLAQLSAYDAVVVLMEYPVYHPVELGNVLADYVDAGGGLVITAGTTSTTGIQGRLSTGNYMPFTSMTTLAGTQSLGTADSLHPIMDGVSSLFSSHSWETGVAPGAREVASSLSGLPLVATSGNRVAGLNVSYYNKSYRAGAALRLLHNALWWSAGGDWLGAAVDTGVVAPGGRVEVTTTFDATRIACGTHVAEVAIATNDPAHPSVTVPVSMEVPGDDPGHLHFQTVPLDFDTLETGLARTLPATVWNSGCEPVTVSAVSVSGDGLSAPSAGFVVPARQIRSIPVTFAPTVVAEVTGSLVVHSDDPAAPELTIAIHGLGIAPVPHVQVSKTTIQFGEVVLGEARADSVVVSNTGRGALTVSAVSTTGPGFSATGAGFVLAPQESRNVPITFAPIQLGPVSGTLVVQSDDPQTPFASVGLNGTGIGQTFPRIQAAPTRLEFGEVPLGTAPVESLIVTNIGSAWLTVSGLTLAGAGFAAPTTPFQLRPQQSRALLVTFTPAEVGEVAGSLVLHSDDARTPVLEVPLHGAGVTSSIAVVPAAFEEQLAAGETRAVELEIRNGGTLPLHWTAEARTGETMAEPIPLADVLSRLARRSPAIAALVPSRYDFDEGETGNCIYDGGSGMYAVGNILKTDRGTGRLPYTNGALGSSALLGTSAQPYFTAKYPGLFVLAADLLGANSFFTSGSLGYGTETTVDAAELTTTVNRQPYRGYVKRVHEPGIPSVQHLFIVPWSDSTSRTYSPTPTSDLDRVDGLRSSRRIYYLLFSGTDGAVADDAAMLGIMRSFLSAIHGAWLEVAPVAGTVAGGASSRLTVTFDAGGRAAGTYAGQLVLTSDDPAHPQSTVPASMLVTGPTAILASLLSATAEPGVVRLAWSVAGEVGAAFVDRATEPGSWTRLGTIPAVGGEVRFEDRSVQPGTRYGYRLGIARAGTEVFAGEGWVDVPRAAAFALRGPTRNPASGDLAIAFSLPDAQPARLELLDVTGRRVEARDVGGLGAGEHEIAFGIAGRAPGVYIVRLTRAGRSLTSRVAVIR